MDYFKDTKKEDKEKEREAMEKSIVQTSIIQKLFTGKEGELGLKAIDEVTGYTDNTFSSDPCKHAYKAGMRAVSVILHHIIERDVKEARKHLKETKNE
jgi:hypothetical protein